MWKTEVSRNAEKKVDLKRQCNPAVRLAVVTIVCCNKKQGILTL